MTIRKPAALAKLAGLLFGAVLTIGINEGAEATPLSYSRDAVEIAPSDGPVIKTVTRAGVAHRSARRTSRRVMRRR
jgi:hypothetical protein